jgi:hypothetical protein
VTLEVALDWDDDSAGCHELDIWSDYGGDTMDRFVFKLIALAFVANGFAQNIQLPAPNAQGWIKLFRGDNTADFYSHTMTGQTDGAFPSNTFRVTGDTVRVSGSPTGHFAFKQVFSHYHVRVQMRHERAGNAGMLLHTREKEPSLGVYPRSLEMQGNTSGMGELWTIGGITVDVRKKAGTNQYDPNGTVSAHGDAQGRQCRGLTAKVNPLKEWDTLEAKVYGADSIEHIVNGMTTIKYTKIRAGTTPINNGVIVWQSEGVEVWYKMLEIKLLPGDSLYKPVYARHIERNTIRPMPAKKILALDDGVLSFRKGGSETDLVYDLAGRVDSRAFPISWGNIR